PLADPSEMDATNGIFYTVHTELTNLPTLDPTNGHLPGLITNGYTTTVAVDPPAATPVREAVLVEWTDTNNDNTTFESTARELLRASFNDVIHPIGDLIFNPLAQPGDVPATGTNASKTDTPGDAARFYRLEAL
ncbi:MAG: hypothetical protein ABSA69_09670, partial [Verrucomicrobiota bacterium]